MLKYRCLASYILEVIMETILEKVKDFYKYLDDFSTSELDSENRDILKDEFDELQALISEKLDEITELDLEESDDSDLFPNGRDTDAEDEDGI